MMMNKTKQARKTIHWGKALEEKYADKNDRKR